MCKKNSFLVLIISACCLFSFCGIAAEDGKKVKVSVLLKDANEIMDEAQKTYVDGDSVKAVELYRKALVELIKIEQQYPERVTSVDFAPLRFRRALCETEVDRIMLDTVNASSRSVAVTDTRELERKRRERAEEAATNKFAKVSKRLTPKGGDGRTWETVLPEPEIVEAPAKDSAEKKPAEKLSAKDVNMAEELEWAKDMFSVEKYAEAEKSLILILRDDPESFKVRYLMALTLMRQNKLMDAGIVLEDLLDDYGGDEGVLLLAAGLYTATQQYAKAMTTLDKALQAAPHRPDGYINMAWLLLEMNPKQLGDPEMYYRRSVELGGKRDNELEKRLGIRQD
ncbi:MAG: hypothetical protein PHO37_14830 [Kiritimatiellae bacterium]|nr:hypothetical protein [Kiritimatiellia bacterium]